MASLLYRLVLMHAGTLTGTIIINLIVFNLDEIEGLGGKPHSEQDQIGFL